MNIITEAQAFAMGAHQGQKRKHSGKDYIEHPRAVAKMLADLKMSAEVIAAGWLHDVIEDCNVTYTDLKDKFGKEIADLVFQVTKPQYEGDRHTRWLICLEYYVKASSNGHTLKLVDRICNLRDVVEDWDLISETDREFYQKVYLKESENLFYSLIGSYHYSRLSIEFMKLHKLIQEKYMSKNIKQQCGPVKIIFNEKTAEKIELEIESGPGVNISSDGYYDTAIITFYKKQVEQLVECLTTNVLPNMVYTIEYGGREFTHHEIMELYKRAFPNE